MDRVVWCILVSLFTIPKQVSSQQHNIAVHPNMLWSEGVSGYALETILTKHDIISRQLQELREDMLEQRKIVSENQGQLKVTLELLSKMQQEMQNQWKEAANDREKVSMWQAEVQTTIRTNQIETANVIKEVLRNIATNRAVQDESIKLMHTVSETGFSDILDKQERNTKSLDDISQNLNALKLDLTTQREEVKQSRNDNLKSLKQLDRDHKQMQNSLLDIQVGYQSCKDVPMKVSGKYKIRVNNESASFEAYCNQQQVGGGWMVIQQRWDGKENFNRNWTDYWHGFGEVDREHWLGLERIHQFTKVHKCELLIELKDFSGNYKYAWYDSFAIGSGEEWYSLKTLGTYKGTAGDSLKQHKGMKFSTPDRDKDSSAGSNCAKEYQGGWWFHACHNSFLNGLYRNASGLTENRISWNSFSDDYRGLYYSRMMIRPLN